MKPKKTLWPLFTIWIVVAACEIPQSPLYVKGPHYAVAISGVSENSSGALSICDLAKGKTPLKFDITAYEEDGSLATTYHRAVNLQLVDVDAGQAVVPMTPATTATLVGGKVSVSGITLAPTAIVPNHRYKVQVSDPKRPGVTSLSPPFVMNLERVRFFRVQITNASLTNYSVSVKITAYSTQGLPCVYFGGTVDLTTSNGKFNSTNKDTVSVTLNNGTYSGTLGLVGPFTIAAGAKTPTLSLSATYSTTQPSTLATGQCFDGANFDPSDEKNQLENDTGKETDDTKKIDPSSGGGGGGGSGGGDTAVFAEPGSLGLTLTPAAELVAVNTSTSVTASITKKDSTGGAFSSFSGTITLKEGSDVLVGPMPVSGFSKVWSSLKFSKGGEHLLTAELTDDASTLKATATGKITAAEVGIFGDEATNLAKEFNADSRFSFKFIAVSSLTSLPNLPALIINKAGSGWAAQGGSDLTNAQVDSVVAFYNQGGHVLFGHDTIPAYAVTNFLVKHLGFTAVTAQIDLASLAFQLNSSSPVAGSLPSLTPFNERYTDGYILSDPAQRAVTITSGATTFAIVATSGTSSTTRAVVMRDLYDTYGGQFSPETQWWEANPQFVVNTINWLVTGSATGSP